MNPALGSPAGDHRVLEPPGATPATARRLDALGDLWDGELRIDLEALVLDADDLAAWRARTGGGPTALQAAMVEVVAERGGLDGELGRGTYLGRVAAVGRDHPWPAAVGDAVALPLPALVVPAFALPGPWDGSSPVVPLRGHAIAPAGVPTVLLPDGVSATAARSLARFADVPAALDALPAEAVADGVVVLGGASVPGAIALAHLVARGVRTAAVVESLEGARLADALGVGTVVVADLTDAPGSAQVIGEQLDAEVVGGTSGSPAAEVPGSSGADAVEGRGSSGTPAWAQGSSRFGAAVVAEAAAGALAVRLAPRVLVVGDVGAVTSVAGAATYAAGAVEVLVHREPGAGRGSRVHDLVASVPVLAEVLRWRTGHPVPRTRGHELPPWERT
jgi:L-erythro-3,5-diaminohexanoate dehydrogenase